MNKALRYLKGILKIIGFLLLAVVGLFFLDLIEMGVGLVYAFIVLIFVIIAIFVLPYYLGKKKEIKATKYSLKNVKK